MSTSSSGTVTASALAVDHRHRSTSTRKNSRVVIAIVAVTAMPYAAARLLEERKATTRPTHPIISSQLTSGT